MNKLLPALAIFLSAAIAWAGEDSLPNRISIQHENLSPEGIEYDPLNERFLLSSMSEGTVFAVADDGTITPFIEDEDLISSIGLEVDTEGGRLLVVNADIGMGEETTYGVAQLGIYDLHTGEQQHMVELGDLLPGERHFANDVAIDADGNAYITDSLAPVIYQVTTEGDASIFLQADALLIEGFGGNGIVYHPDGYLLVGISGVELYKVPLDNPASWSIVEADQTVQADGMLWHPDGYLIIVNNGEVIQMASADDWATAETIATSRNHPATTAAFREDAVYVIYPFARDNRTYQIVRVTFRES